MLSLPPIAIVIFTIQGANLLTDMLYCFHETELLLSDSAEVTAALYSKCSYLLYSPLIGFFPVFYHCTVYFLRLLVGVFYI